MDQYITKSGQNIFDVCITLYGSVEGVFDLLMSNTSLSVTDDGPKSLVGQPLTFDTTFSKGIILNYHSGFMVNSDIVSQIQENDIFVANGNKTLNVDDRSVKNRKIIVKQEGKTSKIKGSISSGEMIIEWGDNTNFETISGSFDIEHAYKDSGKHTIYISGNFNLTDFDLSEVKGKYYALDRINVSGRMVHGDVTSKMEGLFG